MSALAPADFLTDCLKQGIRLRAEGTTLRATGKPPAVPAAFTAYLRHHKPALLALLAPAMEPVPVSPPPLPPQDAYPFVVLPGETDAAYLTRLRTWHRTARLSVPPPRWTEQEEQEHRAYWDRLLRYWEGRVGME